MMYKTLFLLFILAYASAVVKAEDEIMIWVEFSDKKHNNYSLSKPHEFLTPKALVRRQIQGIPLDVYDLPVSQIYIDSLLSDTTLQLIYTSRWFNGAMLKTQSSTAINRLGEFNFISFTERAKVISRDTTKNSALQSLVPKIATPQNSINGAFPSAYPFQTDYGDYGATRGQIEMLNGQYLHQEGYWGRGMTIAVLDGGYRSVDTLQAFQDLWINNNIVGVHDFVESKAELYKGHAHGTYVLSVMAANIPDQYLGVAPAASYWLLRTEDAASEYRIEEYNWLAGAEFADSVGADIINSSLGYTVFDDVSQNYSYADLDGSTAVVTRAANMAFSRGMLVVNSAGNYGTQSWKYLGAPADGHGVLAVGGTDSQGNIASFSSLGPTADGRIKPQVVAQGQGVSIVNYLGTVSTANGTSFSSPLISGLSACLWQRFPEATNVEITNAIIKSADRYSLPDSAYGFGMANFYMAAKLLEEQLIDREFLKLVSNPLIPESAITFYAYEQDLISIEMFNSSGQRVWLQEEIAVFPGFNEIKPFTNISSLASGIYLIRVNFKNKAEFIKSLKL